MSTLRKALFGAVVAAGMNAGVANAQCNGTEVDGCSAADATAAVENEVIGAENVEGGDAAAEATGGAANADAGFEADGSFNADGGDAAADASAEQEQSQIANGGAGGQGGSVEAEDAFNSDANATSTSGANAQNGDQRTDVRVDGNNSTTELDARNQSTITQANDGNNSSNAAQGNTTTYTDNSLFKSGAAAKIPQAAAIFATNKCAPTVTAGLGAGNVFGDYAGLSFGYAASGAVEITAENADGEPMSYLITDIANMDPLERGQIFSQISGKAAKTASCLASNFKAQVEILTAKNGAEIIKVSMQEVCDADENACVPYAAGQGLAASEQLGYKDPASKGFSFLDQLNARKTKRFEGPAAAPAPRIGH